MLIQIKTTYSGLAAAMAKGAGTTTQLMRLWLENAYEKALVHWHANIRPKHFQESAISEYGYRSRTADYEDRKEDKFGHSRPLVYTGESQRATEQFQVRPTSKGATLAMGAGNLAFQRGKGPNLREELTTVSLPDTAEMGQVFERSMDMQIRGWPGRFSTST
jgi:hypothetical protein